MNQTRPTARTRNSRPPSRSPRRRRKKPAGRLTIMLLAILVVALFVQIVRVNGQIHAAQAEEAAVAQRLAEIQAVNQQLQDEIDNSTDPALIEGIARDQLGMVREGEKVFHISK